ncbi:ABC transporter substrate-binding protein [Microbispora sp. CA-102843]|uniref:ABC transporter substrate-binding protein n=1 Tax=Microbispora sp. CA-102843 TaxID=3239952 RepID=UPI003D91E9EF
MKHLFRAACTLAAAVSLSLTAACGGSAGTSVGADELDLAPLKVDAATAAHLKDLYTKATDSGDTKIVGYMQGWEQYQKVWDAFQKRFPGITTKGLAVNGPELTTKLSAERSSGKHVGSLLGGPDFQRKDVLKPLDLPAAKTLAAAYREDAGIFYAPTTTVWGIEYNSDKVTGADVPKKWSDLLDPKWKGRIVAGDATTPSATSGTLIRLYGAHAIDDAWLDRLKAQDVTFKSSLEIADQSVARGEFDILLTTLSDFYFPSKRKGAPIGFAFPLEDGNVSTPTYFAALKDGAAPEATELLMNWLFTAEAQQAFAGIDALPTMPGAPAVQGLVPLDQVKLLDIPGPEEITSLWDPMTAKFKDVFGTPKG